MEPVNTNNQQSNSNRKESNNSASLGGFDLSGANAECNNLPESENISGSTTVTNIAVDANIFDSSMNNPSNQLRWDPEGSVSSNSANGGSRKQQNSNYISEQTQVANRLIQIRDYINQTTNVMERLQAAGSPQHIELWLRLHDKLEGLRDSEIKLSAILDTFNKLQALESLGFENEDNDDDDSSHKSGENQAESVPKSLDPLTRKNELKIKVEESQRKLNELRQQQAALLSLKQKAVEQLNESIAAQSAVLDAEEGSIENPAIQDCNKIEERLQCLHNFYEARNELAQLFGNSIIDSETSVGEVDQLQNKLEELQNKKMHINKMVTKQDDSSVLSNLQQLSVNGNSGNVSNDNMENSNENINIGGYNFNSAAPQSTEEKIAELAILKDQLAKMQSVLSSMSKTASHNSSNSSSVIGSSVSQTNQEFDGHFETNNEEPPLPYSNLKQDNRTQAISQNQRQVVQPSAVLPAVPPLGGNGIDHSITPVAVGNVVQQRLTAKSMKLQDAKARLHNLQELLNVVEEFREAGKPIPEKILALLNSPNGPLSDGDNLDLEMLVSSHSQNQQILTSSSSSTPSSFVSLCQPTQNNSASATANSVSREKEIVSAIPSSNRVDVSSIQNLCQGTTTSATAQTKHQRSQNKPNPPNQQQFPITAKQKNNKKKSCPKTNDLEEWMKKDDVRITCINSGINSQHQPVGLSFSNPNNLSYSDVGLTSNNVDEVSRDDDEDYISYGPGECPIQSFSPANGGGNFGSPSASINNTFCTHFSGGAQNFTTMPRSMMHEGECINPSRSASNGFDINGSQSRFLFERNRNPQNLTRPNEKGTSALPTHRFDRGDINAPINIWPPPISRPNVNRRCNITSEEHNFLTGLQSSVENNVCWINEEIRMLQEQLHATGEAIQFLFNQCKMKLLSSGNNRLLYRSQPYPDLLSHPKTDIGATAAIMNHYCRNNENLRLFIHTLTRCYNLLWEQEDELKILSDTISQYKYHEELRNNQNHLLSFMPIHNFSHYNGGNVMRSGNGVPTHLYLDSDPNQNSGFQPIRNFSPVGSVSSHINGTLNNQVPPGNRANNYWDNFRSYSRQNLLSAQGKCNQGRTVSGGSNISEQNFAASVDRFRLSSMSSNTTHISTEIQPPYLGSTPPITTTSSNEGAAYVMSSSSVFSPQPQTQLNASNSNRNTERYITMSANETTNNRKLNSCQNSQQMLKKALGRALSSETVTNSRISRSNDRNRTDDTESNLTFSSASSTKILRNSKDVQNAVMDQNDSNSLDDNKINTSQTLTSKKISKDSAVNMGGSSSLKSPRKRESATVNISPTFSNTIHNNNMVTANSSAFSSTRTDSNATDSYKKYIYNQVAALISNNEQNPNYLMQMFKYLKEINSENDKHHALLAIHNLVPQSSNNSPMDLSTRNHDVNSQQQNANGQKESSNKKSTNQMKNERKASILQEHRNMNRKYKEKQPCSNPAIHKDFDSANIVLPKSCRFLDIEVRNILLGLVPFLNSNLHETCSLSLLESIRLVVSEFVSVSQSVPEQLDALLEDSLLKFQGSRLMDVCDELIRVIADVLLSELTFLRLATSVNDPFPFTGNENNFRVSMGQNDLHEIDDEEGAVGGVARPQKNFQPKMQLNNQNQTSRFFETSDPVVLDTELAEADQSSRHSNNLENSIGMQTSNHDAVTEPQNLFTSNHEENNEREPWSLQISLNLNDAAVNTMNAESQQNNIIDEGAGSNEPQNNSNVNTDGNSSQSA